MTTERCDKIDQPETDQDAILDAAKAAWLKHWELILNAEDIEAELRRPRRGPPLSDYPAAEREMVAREHAEACDKAAADDRTQAEYLRSRGEGALRQCLALQARMDCDRFESFKRWECRQFVSRFGRIEADSARSIEPHPGFLAQSSARGWRW